MTVLYGLSTMRELVFMKMEKVQSSLGQAALTQLLPPSLPSWCHTHLFPDLLDRVEVMHSWEGWRNIQTLAGRPPCSLDWD